MPELAEADVETVPIEDIVMDSSTAMALFQDISSHQVGVLRGAVVPRSPDCFAERAAVQVAASLAAEAAERIFPAVYRQCLAAVQSHRLPPDSETDVAELEALEEGDFVLDRPVSVAKSSSVQSLQKPAPEIRSRSSQHDSCTMKWSIDLPLDDPLRDRHLELLELSMLRGT